MSQDMSQETMLITPDTKVGALLDTFPELESVLIEIAPAFKTLKNPVLRRTVAKVATLGRAAGVAGIPARELILKLRSAVGQSIEETDLARLQMSDDSSCSVPCSSENAKATEETPSWFSEERIVVTIDADAMLAQGNVPLNKILQQAKTLSGGQILQVTVDFMPTPLIEALHQQNFRTYCRHRPKQHHELFVSKEHSPKAA